MILIWLVSVYIYGVSEFMIMINQEKKKPIIYTLEATSTQPEKSPMLGFVDFDNTHATSVNLKMSRRMSF